MNAKENIDEAERMLDAFEWERDVDDSVNYLHRIATTSEAQALALVALAQILGPVAEKLANPPVRRSPR